MSASFLPALQLPSNLRSLGKSDAVGFLALILGEHGFSNSQANSLSRWMWGQIVDDIPTDRIVLELPARKEFRQRFPAIHSMRDSGLLPPTVQQYLQYERDIQSIVESYGLPSRFRSASQITQLLTNQVSPTELNDNLQAVSTEILARGNEIRDFYRQTHGITGLSDGALLASAFTPGTSPHVFEQQIRTAQIGGTAAEFGFERPVDAATRLAEFGLDLPRAQQFFGQARGTLPVLSDLVRRHRDPDDDFDISEFEQALIFQDPTQQQRISRLFAQEQSLFSRTRLQQITEGGAVTGLRQQ